jgi:hypothetical protein
MIKWLVLKYPVLLSVWLFQIIQFRHILLTMIVSAILILDLLSEYDNEKN